MVDKNRRGGAEPRSRVDEYPEDDEIARYRKILAREPSSLVFAALAEAYRKRSMLDLAISTCKKGLRKHPDFVSGRVALARSYSDAGHTDLARAELERAVLRAPDNLAALRLLAEIYRSDTDGVRLEKVLHRILALDPQDAEAKEGLAALEDRQGVREAGGAEQGPADDGGIWTRTLAEIYADQGFPDKAFEIYQRLSWQDPENTLFHQRLADLKERAASRAGRRGRRDGEP